MGRKSRVRAGDLIRKLRSPARLLLRSQLLKVFLVLCVAGIIVGLESRPDRSLVPYAELFREMSVASYRESPSDTTAHFVVDLCAGGKVFSRYDVDAAAFTAPPRDRDYNRAITRTVYRPLQVRGHVARGMWLDRRLARPSLLPEQFDELYQATLDFVKPVSSSQREKEKSLRDAGALADDDQAAFSTVRNSPALKAKMLRPLRGRCS